MNLLSKISYNTYNDLYKFSTDLAITTPLFNIVNRMTINDPTFSIIMLATSLSTATISLFNYFNDSASKTKEIVYIRNLYNNFIKDYNKLNKIFNFNNPNEIFTMFTYLLHNGYLSKNKKFIHDDSNAFDDITDLLGTNVMTGKAVCRHSSFLLKDIFSDMGDKGFVLPVFASCNFNLFYDKIKEDVDAKALADFIAKIEQGNTIYESLKWLLYVKNYLISDIDNIEYSNHMITGVSKDGKTYFLDPTNETISKRIGGCLIDNEGNVSLMCEGNIKTYNEKEKQVRANILLPNTTFEEDFLIINNTEKTCEENIYIFDKFYNEHYELYEEVNNTLSKINKKKIKRR